MDKNANVSLTISNDIVMPIVTAKINEAVLSALGGAEGLINRIVDEVLNQKVNSDGKKSSYSSDNKYNWIDAAVTIQVKTATETAIKEILSTRQDEIKAAIVKKLSSRKGIENFAQSLLDASVGSAGKYNHYISVIFKNKD